MAKILPVKSKNTEKHPPEHIQDYSQVKSFKPKNVHINT